MPVTIVPGLTGAEMMDDVSGLISFDTINISDHATKILRWLNSAQLMMFNAADWEDLRVNDKAITSTGAASYNLKTLISDFGRIISDSVRCGTRYLVQETKSLINERDPDASNNGLPQKYSVAGNELFTYPIATSGLTITLDYIKMPTLITSTTVAADISFYPEHHRLIVDGAIYFGSKNQKKTDWQYLENSFLKAIKKESARGFKYRATPKQITRRDF